MASLQYKARTSAAWPQVRRRALPEPRDSKQHAAGELNAAINSGSFSPEIDFLIVRSEDGLRALYNEWQELQSACGKFPFTDPRVVQAWWHIQGEQNGEKLHIVTGRHRGQLVAVAPLAVVRKRGVRLLRWAGSDMFDYCDSITQNDAVNASLWRSVQTGGGFDVALLKSVHPETSTHRLLSRFAKQLRRTTTYAITVNGTSDSGWKKKLVKSKYRQKLRKLESKGPIQFEVVTGSMVPDAVFSTLMRQKTEWAVQRGKAGIFDDPPAADAIVRGIATALSKAGTLHFSWLKCGNDIIATQLGCMLNHKLYLYIPSYDLSWSTFSPGQHLFVKILEWATHNGLAEVDLLRGEDAYKADAADIQRSFSDFIFAGSISGQIVELVIRYLYSAHTSLPSVLQEAVHRSLKAQRQGVARIGK